MRSSTVRCWPLRAILDTSSWSPPIRTSSHAPRFFKPQTGYEAKAAYRGEKITKRVFEQLFQTPYVAQALVPPSQRRLEVSSEPGTKLVAAARPSR